MTDEILTKNQIAFLQKCQESDFLINNFYLTGGTALAAFYLKHRHSEDLDFFSESEFDILNIDVFIKKFQDALNISKIDFQQSYNRNIFFLTLGKEVLKTEFTFFPFTRIERGQHEYGIEIDSLIDIAVNKLFTIYQRTQARDYIDLYFICREKSFAIKDLIAKAKIKFDWHIDSLQLGTQFIKGGETKDYPRMIKNIRPEIWQTFFIKEAKKLKGEIIDN